MFFHGDSDEDFQGTDFPDWFKHHDHDQHNQHKKIEWDDLDDLVPKSWLSTMELVSIVCAVIGLLLVGGCLLCCCRRKRGQVLQPPPATIPPVPPGPHNTAPYPQQQYAPYPTVTIPVVSPYPVHNVMSPAATAGHNMGPAVGLHPTAPSATDVYAPPPSYDQVVGVSPHHTSPYNPQFKQ